MPYANKLIVYNVVMIKYKRGHGRIALRTMTRKTYHFAGTAPRTASLRQALDHIIKSTRGNAAASIIMAIKNAFRTSETHCFESDVDIAEGTTVPTIIKHQGKTKTINVASHQLFLTIIGTV